MTSDFLIAGQVVGSGSSGYDDDWGTYIIGSLSSSAFWLEGYSDDEGKLDKTLVVTNAAFGLSAGASLADLSTYFEKSASNVWYDWDYKLKFTYSDGDGNESNDLVGNVRYEGNLASKPFLESFVENADGSYSYSAAGMGLGFYTDTELTDNSQDKSYGKGYALKYRDKIKGGDTFSLYGFASGLSLRDNILYLGSQSVGTLNGNILTVTDFRALDIAYLSAGGSRAVSLIDKDGDHNQIAYELKFDSSLTAQSITPATFSLSGASYIFTSAYDDAYVSRPVNKSHEGKQGTNITTAVYYAPGLSSTLFAINGLSTGSLGDLTVDVNGWIYSGGSAVEANRIAFFDPDAKELQLRDSALSSVAQAGTVIKLINLGKDSYKFDLFMVSNKITDYGDLTNNGNGIYYFSKCTASTVGFYLEDDTTVRYNPDELQNKTFTISGLRDDLGDLDIDKYNGYIRANSQVIGRFRGFTITLYENALPARQSVTVTATDGNTYSVTLDYNVALSGTNAADFTLVLPR